MKNLDYCQSMLNRMLSFMDNKNTRKTCENALGKFLSWIDNNYNGVLPTRDEAVRWRDSLNVAKSTWYQYWMWVQRFYDYLDNPTEYKVRPVQNRAFLKDALSIGQVNAVLGHTLRGAESGSFKDIRDNCILTLLFYTGMRIGELTSIDMDDITDTIDMVENKPIYTIRLLLKGRNTKDHIVTVTNGAWSVLNHYIDVRKKAVDGGRGALFIEVYKYKHGIGSDRLSPETISRLVKAKFKAVGIDDKRLTAHSIRHTTATNALMNGANLRQVGNMLGHASVKTTERYIHMIPEIKAENHINYDGLKALEV